MDVSATIIEIYLDGERYDVPSVMAQCSRCGYETESYGQGEASRKRCLALLREGCPYGEHNFYVEDYEPLPAPKPKSKPKQGGDELRLLRDRDGVTTAFMEGDALWLECVDTAGHKFRLYLDVYDVTELLMALKHSAIEARR